MFNFKKNKYYLGVFTFLILILVFIGFQNCSKINLHGITPPQTQTAPLLTPPQPATINIDSSVTPTTVETSSSSSCVDFGSQNWPGTRFMGSMGATLGLQCPIQVGKDQYAVIKFHTPILEEAEQLVKNATMGNLVMRGAFFAISASEPSGNQISVAPNCSNNNNVFLNWALHGASTDKIVGSRTDVCFLEPDKDYWLVVGQSQAASQDDYGLGHCSLADGETCGFKFDVNVDNIIVNEGYDEPISCQYQKDDPLFQSQTIVTPRVLDGKTPGWGRPISVSNVSPTDFSFKNILTSAYAYEFSASYQNDHNDYNTIVLGTGTALDVGVLDPGYPSDSKHQDYLDCKDNSQDSTCNNTPAHIVALRFHTSRFGKNAGALQYQLGINSGFQSRIGLYTSLQSFSECPGDFNSSTAKKFVFLSGYNLLQVNGHYINQDRYYMPRAMSGLPTGVFVTEQSPYHVLRPDADYYWNIGSPIRGCVDQRHQDTPPQYCATGITSIFMNMGQQGGLFYVDDQN